MVVNLGEEEVFWYLWKGREPSSVLALSWTLILDKIPRRVNLAKRGVLDAETTISVVCFVVD